MAKFTSLIAISFFFFTIATTQTFASEGDSYSFSWLDPDKEVFVLQNRKFRKSGRFHINLGFGVTTSGPFVDATSLQGRGGYFFNEDWGFEVMYASNSGDENDTAASVRRNSNNLTGSTPFRRIIDNYVGGMLLWSPFYSKINTFNSIIYLDLILGVGYAKLEETNNRLEVLSDGNNDALTTETHSGLLWTAALKFYVTENFNIRTDMTTVHYQAAQATVNAEEEFFSNWDLSISIGYNF